MESMLKKWDILERMGWLRYFFTLLKKPDIHYSLIQPAIGCTDDVSGSEYNKAHKFPVPVGLTG